MAQASESDDDLRRDRISTRRLEAYTDGVFAIAATLLVLDLSLDKLGLGAGNMTGAKIWAHLGENWASLLSFAVSFFVLSLLWAVHVRQFEYVKRSDTALLWLNSIRLFGVVLIPFTTSLNGQFSDTVPGRVLLPANFFFVILMGWWQWQYATGRDRGLVEGLDEARIRRMRRESTMALILSGGVVVLAPFIGSLAFLLFAINSVIEHRRPRRKRAHATP